MLNRYISSQNVKFTLFLDADSGLLQNRKQQNDNEVKFRRVQIIGIQNKKCTVYNRRMGVIQKKLKYINLYICIITLLVCFITGKKSFILNSWKVYLPNLTWAPCKLAHTLNSALYPGRGKNEHEQWEYKEATCPSTLPTKSTSGLSTPVRNQLFYLFIYSKFTDSWTGVTWSNIRGNIPALDWKD
jgi:hypothetical protein